MTNKVIINASNGHGYKYAALADIANQGYQIPKMKVETNEYTLKDYVFYYDSELKEWIRGAEIIIPENIISKEGKAKMNAAQLYGSAMTYARRYTALLALGLACEDDKEIEDGQEIKANSGNTVKATQNQIGLIKRLYDNENQAKILEYYGIQSFEELSVQQASQIISKKKEQNNG